MASPGCCGCIGGQVRDAGDAAGPTNFPDPLRLWVGGDFKLLGSGIKYRKIVFIRIQLYAVAMYVEEAPAAAELRALDKQGFFTDYSEAELCAALLAGRFRKLLQIRLLRSVTYSQFTDEIGRDLKPRLDKAGDDALWLRFADYFRDRPLGSGTDVLALCNEDGSCEGGWFPAGTQDFAGASPTLRFDGPDFARALLDVYVGPSAIVPDARAQWAQSALALLQRPSC